MNRSHMGGMVIWGSVKASLIPVIHIIKLCSCVWIEAFCIVNFHFPLYKEESLFWTTRVCLWIRVSHWMFHCVCLSKGLSIQALAICAEHHTIQALNPHKQNWCYDPGYSHGNYKAHIKHQALRDHYYLSLFYPTITSLIKLAAMRKDKRWDEWICVG